LHTAEELGEGEVRISGLRLDREIADEWAESLGQALVVAPFESGAHHQIWIARQAVE
jgi:hypothetical protein